MDTKLKKKLLEMESKLPVWIPRIRVKIYINSMAQGIVITLIALALAVAFMTSFVL